MLAADDLEFDDEEFPDDVSQTETDDELALSDEELDDVSVRTDSIDINVFGVVLRSLQKF